MSGASSGSRPPSISSRRCSSSAGRTPLIILEDADPDLAVDAAVFGAFMNSGQLCMSTDRIIIHESLVERFIPRYVERVKALPAGDPADPATIVGPLINTRGAQRISKLVNDAATKGATQASSQTANTSTSARSTAPSRLTTSAWPSRSAAIFWAASWSRPASRKS
jgi:acyl-CoA reductase-like NAD-dependent aldehyde dehydrogenase